MDQWTKHMKQQQTLIMTILSSVLLLSACHKEPAKQQEQAASSTQNSNPDVLPYLDIQTKRAEYALPFCEKKNCIDIDIQSLVTKDPWLNHWITANQSKVVQAQIDLKQNLSLQQAINAYVKKSDDWQHEFSANQPYRLHIQTRVASQRNQYVLLQMQVSSRQADVEIKERQYFFVADRKLQKDLSILDVIEPKQQVAFDGIVQSAYQQWLKKQTKNVQRAAPKKLHWGQADWFFDGEGVGLHYRANEIVKDAKQLEIFLNKSQTQKMLKADVFHKMF